MNGHRVRDIFCNEECKENKSHWYLFKNDIIGEYILTTKMQNIPISLNYIDHGYYDSFIIGQIYTHLAFASQTNEFIKILRRKHFG